MTGLILFAHGSSVEPANEAVRKVAGKVAAGSAFARVTPAFLEVGRPDLRGAVRELAEAGMQRVVIVPYFLVPGVHLTRDLPGIVAELRSIYQSVSIEVTDSLDQHPALVEAVLDRARKSHGGSRPESKVD
jgi:sirohydrochlorin ferrochelatase